MNLGEQLKFMRKKSGMSATEVANKLGVSKSALCNYEKGIRTPTVYFLAEFAKLFDISIEKLISGDNFHSVDKIKKFIEIPILGRVSAGDPIYAEENIIGYTELSGKYCNNDYSYFALYVVGDSMNNCRICEGDIVIVREQDDVDNGEIAVVLIDNENATIKKYFRNENNVTLMPSSTNPIHKPRNINMTQTPVKVLGKVVEVKINL